MMACSFPLWRFPTNLSTSPMPAPTKRNQLMSLVLIERTLHPTETQRARLAAVLVQASDRMRVA